MIKAEADQFMNADQKYGFDVWGFIHLTRVLDGAELAACNQAFDPSCGLHRDSFCALLEHPVLTDCLKTICGDDYSMDQATELMGPGADPAARVRLVAGTPERNRRLRYIQYHNAPICHGVCVLWALATAPPAESALVVVPASHKRNFEPPADLLSGDDDMGMTLELPLEAGDLVILAATTLYGLRGQASRLVKSEYVSQRMMPSDGFCEIPPPQWTRELAPEQAAIIGPRTTGIGGGVISDGSQVRLSDETEQTPAMEFYLNSATAPDPKELFFWDVNGYLVLRDIMDEDWLAAAHRSIDAAIEAQPTLADGHPAKFEEVPEAILRENNGEWPADTSSRLRGQIHRPRIGGLYDLPRPHCESFRKMIAHPPIVQRLNWMLGTGFRELFEPMCCIYSKGTSGGSLHGQSSCDYATGGRFPLLDNINVLWSLNDEAPGFGENSGGFTCVPGSHKASYEIPGPKTTSIDLPQVHKPALKAGDVLYFGSVAHGTTAWRSDWNRRNVIQFMASRNIRVRPGALAGWRWSTDPQRLSKAAPAAAHRTAMPLAGD